MNNDRRSFLKQCGGTAAAVVANAALANQVVSPVGAQSVIVGGVRPVRKYYVTGRCLLELEGTVCGWLWFAEGGSAAADVLEGLTGADGVIKKRLGPVRYEDIILSCGAGLGQPFDNWIKAWFGRQPARKSGAIVYLDATNREVSRLSFNKALITEVGLPALDAGMHEPAIMLVRLSPESTRRLRDSAGRAYNLSPTRGPSWQMSNFRLNLDGLAETSSRLIRIEELSVRSAGAGSLTFSNLMITFPASAGQPMESWLEDFLIKGNNADAQE